MNMDLDERWSRWCERFDAAEHDIRTLFLNRHIWLSITEMWEKNADAIELNTLTFNWHINLYVTTQCTGIRRECDADTTTSSLQNCLQELIKFPKMATRSRFDASVEAHPAIPAAAKSIQKSKFDEFAASGQAPEIDPDKVQKDIDRLLDAAKTTRLYTNKIVAHRDHKHAEITLPWVDLDTALNTVGDVLKRYFTLRNPPEIKGSLTPELPLGWERPYQAAWCPPGYMPPRAKSLDDYVHPTAPPVGT
ncbi:hypothetical protein [Streptomyces goshikiensis]